MIGRSSASSAFRAKYGKYLPHQRFNVDQVPLPFCNDMEDTYEEVGNKRVAINQNGPSLGKRQCTGNVCFRGELPDPPEDPAALAIFKKYFLEQPPASLIFRGRGLRISKEEINAYPPGLVVLWQDKAWVDRPTAVRWAMQVWKPFILSEIAAGVAGAEDRYLLFQDNLDSQLQPTYLDYLRNDCATDNHQVPPNKTDQVQPVDRGLGRHIKIYVGQAMDAWLEDDVNLEKWENNELTASARRILLANWYYDAVKRALNGTAKKKYFEHAGMLPPEPTHHTPTTNPPYPSHTHTHTQTHQLAPTCTPPHTHQYLTCPNPSPSKQPFHAW